MVPAMLGKQFLIPSSVPVPLLSRKRKKDLSNLYMYVCLSVKFIIMPEGHVQSMTCSLKQSFSELRNHFSSEFSQPPQVILMIYDGMYGSII